MLEDLVESAITLKIAQKNQVKFTYGDNTCFLGGMHRWLQKWGEISFSGSFLMKIF
jgi:hypothetical protein